MFRNIEFYDEFAGQLFSPWWMYLLMGLNFILMAVLIFIFPEFLAYLVAAFLFLNGVVMVGLAIRVRKWRKDYENLRRRYWIPVE